jgi:hypothetical protein
MTDTYELPELPELPEGRVLTGSTALWVESEPSLTAFTADQMREYGLECARLERERCAAICDIIEVTQEIDNGAANSGGAAACAAAIRAG